MSSDFESNRVCIDTTDLNVREPIFCGSALPSNPVSGDYCLVKDKGVPITFDGDKWVVLTVSDEQWAADHRNNDIHLLTDLRGRELEVIQWISGRNGPIPTTPPSLVAASQGRNA